MSYKLKIPRISEELRLIVHQEHDDGVSADIKQNNIWEPYETELVVDNLAKGDVFVDVGANIGYYSVVAASIVGETGKIIAYEPEPENYHLLLKNLSLNKLSNVQSFQAALSDYNGQGYLYLNDSNRGDHQVYDSGEERNRIETQLICADQHISGLVTKIDFLKIDTQGSETKIIKNLSKAITANLNKIKMIVELWPKGLMRAGSSAGELLDLLFSFELKCYIIDHLNFQLFPATRSNFDDWVVKTESDKTNEGFFNLLLCPKSYKVNNATFSQIPR